MTNQKEKEKKDGINHIVAATTVAVIGAGIAVAGAAVLQDEDNRKKVKQVLSNVKNRAINYIADTREEIDDAKVMVEKKVANNAKKAKKVLHTASSV